MIVTGYRLTQSARFFLYPHALIGNPRVHTRIPRLTAVEPPAHDPHQQIHVSVSSGPPALEDQGTPRVATAGIVLDVAVQRGEGTQHAVPDDIVEEQAVAEGVRSVYHGRIKRCVAERFVFRGSSANHVHRLHRCGFCSAI